MFMREYDQIFDWYVSERSPEVGKPEVAALANALKPNARVLDLGCGTGIPIAEYLLQGGFELYAVDSSSRMIDSLRKRFPQVATECARIQDSGYFDLTYEAVIAWGVLFHLEPADQVTVINRIGRALNPGGTFLFTSGNERGQRDGEMNGVEFHYFSLGAAAYAEALSDAGLRLERHYDDPWENHVYVATKPPARFVRNPSQ